MNISYKRPGTDVVISMTASHASEIASVRNMGTEIGAGVNIVAHEANKDGKLDTQQSNSSSTP